MAINVLTCSLNWYLVPVLDNSYILKLVVVPVMYHYCLFKMVLVPVLNNYHILKLLLVPVLNFSAFSNWYWYPFQIFFTYSN